MMSDILGLKGKRVLITAGASGIGFEIAQQFTCHGAHVIVSDLNIESLKREQDSSILSVQANAASVEGVETTLATVRNIFGGLDILVNNAGVAGPTSSIEETAFDAWQSTMQVNVDSQFLHLKYFTALLRASEAPAVVNLSSAAGLRAFRNRSAYSASKWAVIGLTKTAAAELGPMGIRVNAVCPGVIEGLRLDAVISAKAKSLDIDFAEARELFISQTAMRIPSSARDVADSVLFLASRMAHTVSGQVISVDGFIERMV